MDEKQSLPELIIVESAVCNGAAGIASSNSISLLEDPDGWRVLRETED